MIERFLDDAPADAHHHFQVWRSAHPDGYFLNRRSATSYMLHRVDCPHLTFARRVSLTTREKVCSGDLRALRTWVSKNGAALSSYTDCKL